MGTSSSDYFSTAAKQLDGFTLFFFITQNIAETVDCISWVLNPLEPCEGIKRRGMKELCQIPMCVPELVMGVLGFLTHSIWDSSPDSGPRYAIDGLQDLDQAT